MAGYEELSNLVKDPSDKAFGSVKEALGKTLESLGTDNEGKHLVSLIMRLKETPQFITDLEKNKKDSKPLQQLFTLLNTENSEVENRAMISLFTVRSVTASALLRRLANDVKSIDNPDQLKEVMDFLSSDNFSSVTDDVMSQLNDLKDTVGKQLNSYEDASHSADEGKDESLVSPIDEHLDMGDVYASGGADGGVDEGRILDIPSDEFKEFDDMAAYDLQMEYKQTKQSYETATDEEEKKQFKNRIDAIYKYISEQREKLKEINDDNAPIWASYYDILSDDFLYKIEHPGEKELIEEKLAEFDKQQGVPYSLDTLQVLKNQETWSKIEKSFADNNFEELFENLKDVELGDRKILNSLDDNSWIKIKENLVTIAVTRLSVVDAKEDEEKNKETFKNKLNEVISDYKVQLALYNSDKFREAVANDSEIMAPFYKQEYVSEKKWLRDLEAFNNEGTSGYKAKYDECIQKRNLFIDGVVANMSMGSLAIENEALCNRIAQKANLPHVSPRAHELFVEATNRNSKGQFLKNIVKHGGINLAAGIAVGPLGMAAVSGFKAYRAWKQTNSNFKQAVKAGKPYKNIFAYLKDNPDEKRNLYTQTALAAGSVAYSGFAILTGTYALGMAGSLANIATQQTVEATKMMAGKKIFSTVVSVVSSVDTMIHKTRQLLPLRKQLLEVLNKYDSKVNTNARIGYFRSNDEKKLVDSLAKSFKAGKEDEFYAKLLKAAPGISVADAEKVTLLMSQITGAKSARTGAILGTAMAGSMMIESETNDLTGKIATMFGGNDAQADGAGNAATNIVTPQELSEQPELPAQPIQPEQPFQTDTIANDTLSHQSNVQSADSVGVDKEIIDAKLNATTTQYTDSVSTQQAPIVENTENTEVPTDKSAPVSEQPVTKTEQVEQSNTTTEDAQSSFIESEQPKNPSILDDKNLVFDKDGRPLERFPMQNIDEFNKEVETKFADDKFTIHSFAKEHNNNYLLHMNDSSAYTISEFSDADKADIHYATQMSPTPVVEKLQAAGLWKEGHDRWDSEWTSAKVEQHLLELQNRTDLTPEQQAGFEDVMKYIHNKEQVNADNAAWREAHPDYTPPAHDSTPAPTVDPVSNNALYTSPNVQDKIDTAEYDAAKLYEEAKQRIHDKYTTEDGVKVIHDSQYGASKMIFKGKTLYAFDKDVDGDGKDDYLVGTVNVNDGHGNESTIYAVKASDGKQYLVDDKNNIHEVKNATKEINKIYKNTVSGRSDSY